MATDVYYIKYNISFLFDSFVVFLFFFHSPPRGDRCVKITVTIVTIVTDRLSRSENIFPTREKNVIS